MSRSKRKELVLEGFFAPEDVGRYYSVPFEMPAGVSRVEVSYQYNAEIGADTHLSGGNTLDIGIFDQRGPGAGFRGWSGSARHEFFIGFDEATPGYLPGPLEPGLWHINLGFYKSAPDGCHYKVSLRFFFGGQDRSTPGFPEMLTLDNNRSALQGREDGWYRGELHCHSYHSDGDSDPSALIAAAHELGLDFIAITDHNSISHLADQADLGPTPIVLIPGCEVTTYMGHWNVWGLDSWLDFRTVTPELMSQSIQRAVQRGYLTSCNHPRTGGPSWEFGEVSGYHCVEVWNGPWPVFNHEALAFWEERLRAGKRLVAVGGSDAHFLTKPHIARIGTPTTWIYCPKTPTAVALLAGLRAGHAFVSDSPGGPRLHLRSGGAMMGDTVARPATGRLAMQMRVVNGARLRVELHGSAGLLACAEVADDDTTLDVACLVGQTPYVRAQLVEPGSEPIMIRALSNPIYLDKGR